MQLPGMKVHLPLSSTCPSNSSLRSGSSTPTASSTPPSSSCPQLVDSMQSGLPTTCKMRWASQTSLIPGGGRRRWTPAELNSILQNHMVRNQHGCTYRTFRCVEWESKLYRGVMCARCYLWNMPKHLFHKMNPQVIPCYPWLYTYITGYPGTSPGLANDAAPGLLLDSPALPVQPGGPL